MQDERSQHTNKRRAFQVLRARLLDIKLTQEIASRRATRQSLVKTADRSEKIRTYNYAQDRITDHRVGLTVKNLPMVMEGSPEALGPVLERVRREVEQAAVEEMLEEEGDE
jgi:peptide chain release factor 1